MPVNITGVQGTLKAMRKFDPDLAKQMNTQIRGAMMPIRDKARAFAPSNSEMLSGWVTPGSSDATIKYRAFPKYDQSETQKALFTDKGQTIKAKLPGQNLHAAGRWLILLLTIHQVVQFLKHRGAYIQTAGQHLV